jgi:hypothetical protein
MVVSTAGSAAETRPQTDEAPPHRDSALKGLCLTRVTFVLDATQNVREHVVMASAYVFLDEWDVDAPQEQVFDALADGRTYPNWWTPTYLAVETDGPPELGRVAHQRFKGTLPYVLATTTRLTRINRPNFGRSRSRRRSSGKRDVDPHLTWRQGTRSVRFSRVR